MDRRTLMSRLVPRALHRYRVRVTDLMFGDWLREKLIATPSKRGRVRNWNWRHYRVGLEICRLKSQGVDFAGAIRWHLWIKGFDPPKFNPVQQRTSLLRAFRRYRKLAIKSIYSTYDPRNTSIISEQRAEKLALSMGSQDERLKSILPLGTSELLDARNLVQFDVSGGSIEIAAREYFTRQTRAIAPSLSAETSELFAQRMAGVVVPLLGGLLGEVNEIDVAGEYSIQIASRNSFDLARNMVANLPRLMKWSEQADPLNSAGYSATVRSATMPDWRIGNFVSFLHIVHRGGPDFLKKIILDQNHI